ncbi:MAG: rhodanese-like domain-containing protein [Planctomycetota bacterium]|jgi:sodium/bile acid cotransporter 7
MTTPADAANLQQIEAMYASTRRHFRDIQEISAEDAKDILREENTVVVDVRTAEEQAISMIPGAIPSTDFEQNMAKYENARVICYCTIGHRSGLYTKALQERGWNALNMKGAILAWTHAGGELTSSEGPTQRVHVHNPRCNLVAEGYEPIW